MNSSRLRSKGDCDDPPPLAILTLRQRPRPTATADAAGEPLAAGDPDDCEERENVTTEAPKRTVERQFIIDRQGKPFVLMAGLLDLAHQDGLDLIETHLVQAASDENALTNVFRAIVHTKTGTFTGHGSAGPANASRMMLTHTLELAETRAIGRALRFATNIGMTTIEELGDDPTPGETDPPPTEAPKVSSFTPAKPVAPPPPPPKPAPISPKEVSEAMPPPAPPAAPTLNGNAITPNQLRAIYTIGRNEHGFLDPETDEQCVAVFGVRPSELTKQQASTFITNMKSKAQA